MFVDQIKVNATAGNGGNGIVAYRRELKVTLGGPAGGSGGHGGSIIFVGEKGLSTLMDFRYKRIIKGEKGENGRNKSMTGKNASNTYIKVPLGTLVYDDDTNELIADITKDKQEAVICKGGRGGRGNEAFATGINKCPDFCEKGEPGEERNLRIELKVLADCGLVGYPSVGKSTLISVVSACKPKIASYHFTTLAPNLGMVETKDHRSFVMADLPGLIKGASEGLGLGYQFLRHIERCRVIVHIVDMAQEEGRDPYNDYLEITDELRKYNLRLLERPIIIVASKMDMPNAKDNLEEFKKHFDDSQVIIPISSLTQQNLDILTLKIADLLETTEEFTLDPETHIESFVEYNFKKEEEPFEINFEHGVYNITGNKIKKLMLMTDFTKEEGAKRFARQLRSLGIDQALRDKGVKNGDIVKIFEYEFEFID